MKIVSIVYKYKRYFDVVRQYHRFKGTCRIDNRFRLSLRHRNFQLFDNTANTSFDRHYIYFPAWAFRVLRKINPKKHIDISSTLHFCTTISAFMPTEFYDYRPAGLHLSNLTSAHADITKLPFKSNTVNSLSCMHVLEHIGLGRYGDPIDPDGDIKGAKELVRVMKKGGNLLIVLPVGKQRIEFNAHRIYSYQEVIKLFSNLKIKENYLISDNNKKPITNASTRAINSCSYGCGCFWFVKE